MDSGNFVVGQVERNIDCNNSNENGQTNAVKHEPCEIENFNEFGKHETDFVDHKHYTTLSFQELSEEKFETENFNPEESDYLKFSEDQKIYLNEAFEIDTVKKESSEIDIFTTEYSSYECYSNETKILKQDHNYTTHRCQELSEVKLEKNLKQEDLDHSESSEKLSTNKDNIAQLKNEEYINIFHEDIKCETEEETSSEHYKFCEVCCQSLDRETDFVESTNSRFECSCQKQNESIFDNKLGEDGKETSLGLTTDSEIQQLVIQNDSKAGEEVTKEQDLSAVAQNLKIHKRIHRGQPFVCKICSKSFTRKDHFRRHERGHTGETPFRCKLCSKSFSRMDGLKVHERGHTDDKPFHCKICSKSFSRMGNLKVHERCHTGEKPFSCKVCSKSFGHMISLKSHETSHTTEKSFHCKICSKSFRLMDNFNIHKRSHASEKLLHCKVCSKSFSRMGNLKVHERSHAGEKPFRCKTCSKSYSQIGNLIGHEKSHTGA